MITLPVQSIDTASQDLQQRVALHLQNRQLAYGGRVRVEARGGTVYLSGQVPTFYQRQLVYAATRRVAGVVRVMDELTVDDQETAQSYRGRVIA
jgi:osmotically-inducible protein OsmY